jgi:hypothetical protein
MKAVRILSVGLLSAWIWGCNQSTEPAPRQSGTVNVAPAVNALSKAAALKAGYGMSRVSADTSFNPFSADMAQSLEQLGVCDNFVQLINELVNAGSDSSEQTLMSSARFQNVVSCFESEAANIAANASTDEIFPIFDKCFCNGSGTVFGALFRVSGYSAPHFNGYSAPVAAHGYSSPSVAPGYSSPAPAPGYSSPSL